MKKNTNITSGMIWITGFSASGKTTVSRKVYHELSTLGLRVIHLDGDDLRSIFGNQWGFERDSRIELAHTYVKLCSHLVSQDYIVVLSAVAMFDTIKSWASDNISNITQVYLDVPIEQRVERDKKTKNIYKDSLLSDDYYDIPKSADLIINNHDRVTPTTASREIVDFFLKRNSSLSDNGRTKYWDKYYSNAGTSIESPFAIFVHGKMPNKQTILEIGCGNGRDSQFFSKNEHRVIAIDRSTSAIKQCKVNYSKLDIEFTQGLVSDIPHLNEYEINMVYSRFVIHAMPLEEEVDLLNKVYQLLEKKGMFFIECRSINDNMFRDGDVLSPTERISGHYRRFIILDELIERLKNVGFKVVFQVEEKGLAVFKDEDPMVIRVIAEK
jgi:adenylylsulfate kinase-like enzyme/2-polyprenyl-3-methyl-5-hydroxy-6-metoxy-1,4-benzoquinol methylase